MASKLRSKDFKKIDIHSNQIISMSIGILKKHYKHSSIEEQLELINRIKLSPNEYASDAILSPIAFQFMEGIKQGIEQIDLTEHPAPLEIFGAPLIKENAIQQMRQSLHLPVVKQAALMPDAHLGYGIPIGGVIACEASIIPYAVGMDIGCRMSLTLYDTTSRFFKQHEHKFKQSIINHTAFGISKVLTYQQEHEFFDRDVFHHTPLLKKLKSKAARQLGSSGSGNHFVEWGLVSIKGDEIPGISEGDYIGLMAHSGSRGFGASIAKFYSDIAKDKSCLPYNMRHLGWLGLNSEDGQEYWHAMNLAGDYAKACHDQIHKYVARSVGLKPLCKIENHHNFAWKEMVNGQELIVHRKGATPSGKGALGIIPGSMTDPGHIVVGLGDAGAISSASHGAGRKYSRKETVSKNTKSEMRKMLKNKGISLVGGALDESPFAYKSLEQVMSHQTDLVRSIGQFFPKIVRMDKDK